MFLRARVKALETPGVGDNVVMNSCLIWLEHRVPSGVQWGDLAGYIPSN